MKAKIFDVLSHNTIENDMALPYWVYKLEPVFVANKKFLKIYLFNRAFDHIPLNSIHFQYEGAEYRSYSFSTVSEFNDQDIVGCAVEVFSDNLGQNITVLDETLDGIEFRSSQNNIKYIRKSFPDNDKSLLADYPKYKNNHCVFPQINTEFWQCSCGRIHDLRKMECPCGQTYADAKELISYNTEESILQRYLAKPIVYDLKKTFNENIEAYRQGFAATGMNISLLDNSIDFSEEQKKYNELLSNENEKRKRKSTIAKTIAAFLCVIGFGILSVKVLFPFYRYSSAVRKMENAQYSDAYNIFAELGDYKNSRELMLRCADGSKVDLIKNAELGDTVLFGSYEQDNNIENGEEPIEWIVLEKDDQKVLVITKHILSYRAYHSYHSDVTWETSAIRKWLLHDFKKDAFSESEQDLICSTHLITPVNPEYGTSGGDETDDNVFLLSIEEARKYFASDADRVCGPTLRATKGAAFSVDVNSGSYWWLRSSGQKANFAARVYPDGSIFVKGNVVDNLNGGVRPAMWIDISETTK